MLQTDMIDRAQYEEQLNERWGDFTNDITDADARLNTQLVMENSYKKMIAEGSVPRNWLENNLLNEAPQRSEAVGDYVIPKVMFPIIRRVFPDLIANKLVSVQPLQQPTGVIYYINYTYSNTKGTIKAGNEFTGAPQQGAPAYATWYSSEKIGPFEKTVSVDAANATPVEVDFGAQSGITDFLGTDRSEYTIKRFEVFNATTGKAVPAQEGATIEFNDATGAIKATVPPEAVAVGKDNTFVAYLVYDQEGSKHIPEMEFAIDHMNVDTKERKIKVRWTKEAEQDMMAYHKINVEQELVKIASLQTAYETDREIVKFIDDHVIDPLKAMHDWTADAAVSGNNTQGNYLDRHRALAQKLYAQATKVATFNHLGPCDWAVCSPKVAATLQMLPDWKAGEIASGKTTFYNAGSLGNGSMQIYVDPNRVDGEENTITMGYKSKDSTYGSGVVYSPYQNWMSSTVTNPDNFDNIRGFFQRYAITMCPRGEYNYSQLNINNL